MKNVQKMLRDGEVENKMVAYTDIVGNSPDFYMEAAELLVEVCVRNMRKGLHRLLVSAGPKIHICLWLLPSRLSREISL